MTLTKQEWVARCARRIMTIDEGVSEGEAVELARALYAFERTRALDPESAVDFVASELDQPEPRFERRTSPRDRQDARR